LIASAAEAVAAFDPWLMVSLRLVPDVFNDA
jgi:hypothetical protein